ncbi:glycosyltransferase family 4 protein [Caenispirillum bisanense]|uniref:Glycosyltransferase involved in cell wall bisynthesis n=1 Tax=Caenispirillum bisanense TaxID=414052 RepID=A0A286GR52_9PROT|nr:glycosyltransferase family 4 protein [Caenispirillum bisanense]SOD97982.1 Glycosyltransferase involved in cell wall bisynthesis [Caenispirillum bisanense]
MSAAAAPPAPRCVLMTADTVGGVWHYALELARGLTGRGIVVALATMGRPPTPDQRAAARAVDGLVLEVSGYALEWMRDPWADVEAAGDWLLRLEKRYRPQIVHLNGYAHATLPFAAPVLVVAHSCVRTWFQAVKGAEPGDEWIRYRAEVTAGLRAADLVVAPTMSFLADMATLYGPFGEARTIRNGRDAADYDPTRPKAPQVLAAGRAWDEAKKLRVLQSAGLRGPWPIRIAGDAHGPEGRAQPVPGTEPLGLLGPDRLREEMARSAVFAAPALYEPFGLGVLEAALSGCALVLSDIRTFRELWDGAAAFCPPDDSEAWAAALADLAADDARRKRLAAAALERAQRYSAEAMVRGYADAYADLLTGAVAPPPVAAQPSPTTEVPL